MEPNPQQPSPTPANPPQEPNLLAAQPIASPESSPAAGTAEQQTNNQAAPSAAVVEALNQLNNPVAQPASAPLNTQPAPAASNPQPPMAPTNNNTTAQKSPNKIDLKKMSSQWQFWAMVGAGIFGLVGIILGAYGVITKIIAERDVARIQGELDAANELVVKYATQLGEKVNELGRPGNVSSGPEDIDDLLSGLASATDEYVYIGEWGIKIKIPKKLEDVSYAFYTNRAEVDTSTAEGTSAKTVTTENLCLSGFVKGMQYTPALFSFVNNPEGFGCIYRSAEMEAGAEKQPNYIGKVGDYTYWYSGPNQNPQAPLIGENEQETEWIDEVTELVNKMLTKENISTFKNN